MWTKKYPNLKKELDECNKSYPNCDIFALTDVLCKKYKNCSSKSCLYCSNTNTNQTMSLVDNEPVMFCDAGCIQKYHSRI